MSPSRLFVTFTAVVAVSTVFAITAGFAQQTGETVTIILPVDGNQPEPPSGPGDKLVFTGGRVTSADGSGCESGTFPVQNGVLVDPAGGRSGRLIGIIVVSATTPMAPGTKLVGLFEEPSSPCTAGSVTYHKYRGIVE